MNTRSTDGPVVVILDCGATNIRAMAISSKGAVVAAASEANNTTAGIESSDFHVWPLDEIWAKLSRCTRALLDQKPSLDIVGVAVTTFGVDGALVDDAGDLLYPIISWKCPRTNPVMEQINRYIDIDDLHRITGVGNFSFNTLYKLIWLKEKKPDVVDTASHFLFISSILNHRLTGEMTTDWTMLGTSMFTDRATQGLSDIVLNRTGLRKQLFPKCVYPGEVIGGLTKPASQDLGFKAGTPVISCGHDTQFALFGSGASPGEPVLSSGTWEILMVRSNESIEVERSLEAGITTEFDVERGKYNLGIQWLGSQAIENLKDEYYSKEDQARVYGIMMEEATSLDGRGNLYYQLLEELCVKLKHGLLKLEAAGRIESNTIRLVGGGSKNSLWNQMKADAIGLPIRVIKTNETTVLGAAFFAMAGVGIYQSAREARNQFDYKFEVVNPEMNGVTQ